MILDASLPLHRDVCQVEVHNLSAMDVQMSASVPFIQLLMGCKVMGKMSTFKEL